MIHPKKELWRAQWHPVAPSGLATASKALLILISWDILVGSSQLLQKPQGGQVVHGPSSSSDHPSVGVTAPSQARFGCCGEVGHHLRREICEDSGLNPNVINILRSLPMLRQLRFAPICWRQQNLNMYEDRFSKYMVSCLVADIRACCNAEWWSVHMGVLRLARLGSRSMHRWPSWPFKNMATASEIRPLSAFKNTNACCNTTAIV